MPSYCAVPSCKHDKYKGGKNPSTFRVPNDESLREKWIVSIPGIEFLTLNQRVCEKHFEKHLLIKEYVKYDSSGKLIAQVPLAHARLKKGAVPTIFDQTIGPSSSHKILTTDHAYALRPCRSGSTSKAEAETVCVNTLNNIDIYSSDLFEYRPIVRVRRIKKKVFEQRVAIVQFLMYQKKNEKLQKVETRASPNKNIDDPIEATNIAFGCLDPVSKIDIETVYINTFNSPDTNVSDSLSTDKFQDKNSTNNIENTLRREVDFDTSTEIKTEFAPIHSEYVFLSTTSNIKHDVTLQRKDEVPKKGLETEYRCAVNVTTKSKFLTANDKAQKDTSVHRDAKYTWTNVTFDSISFDLKSLDEDNTEDNLCIKLPKPWNANKLIKTSEETLLLSCIVQIDEYGIQKHVLEKAVIIKASREMIYEIYSTPVDVTPAKLPKFLQVISMLPEILKKFKDLRTCEGIMTVDLDYVQNQADFKRDIYSNLRHKDCSVLSVHSKRCITCKKASKILSQKVKRIKDRQNMQRVSNSESLLEQMKLKALRKKLKFRGAESYRLKNRLQVLTNFLLDRQSEVANVSNDVLGEVSKSHRPMHE